jgi:hypothetical protein
MENMSFIEDINGFLIEVQGYKSKVNYNKLFDELDNSIKQDLYDESLYYINVIETHDYFATETIISFSLDCLDDVSNIGVDIEFFIHKYDNLINKIGFNTYIKNTGFGIILQSFEIDNFDIENENVLLNHIFNTFFYVYILIKHFQYNSLFTYLYHSEDIEHIVQLRERRIRLFGNDKMECCVCLNKTLITTSCGHFLCQYCFSRLNNRTCPLCRNNLEENNISSIS